MTTFTWNPDYQASADKQPRIKAVAFGDGYEQRYNDGLNPIRQVWTLSFVNRDLAEAAAIDAFLIARNGVEAFDWTPPRAVAAGKYVCKQWQRIPTAGPYDTITAVFTQVFEA